MRPNHLKGKLKAGQPALGCSVMFPSPQIVEMLGHAGFDWVLLDCEHGSLSLAHVEIMAMAADAVGITPIARPAATPRPTSKVSWIVASWAFRFTYQFGCGCCAGSFGRQVRARCGARPCRRHPAGRMGARRSDGGFHELPRTNSLWFACSWNTRPPSTMPTRFSRSRVSMYFSSGRRTCLIDGPSGQSWRPGSGKGDHRHAGKDHRCRNDRRDAGEDGNCRCACRPRSALHLHAPAAPPRRWCSSVPEGQSLRRSPLSANPIVQRHSATEEARADWLGTSTFLPAQNQIPLR